jgi:hypothetical protein
MFGELHAEVLKAVEYLSDFIGDKRLVLFALCFAHKLCGEQPRAKAKRYTATNQRRY